MAQAPVVLLLDDGELEDVKDLLEQSQIPYARVRGGAIAPNTPPPRRLLVTTPRRISSVKLADPSDPAGDSLVRIVVVEEDSRTLRSHLREVGFDYLVRRPVHPEALRLLLLHCVFSGDERRAEPRIPVGFEVSFRSGLLPRKATMVDLSTRGCRLLSKWGLEPGKRITVTIPERVGIAESIALKGRVVRMRLDERLGELGPYSAAVAFDGVSPEVRHELEWILEERARGPATLGLREPERPAPGPEEGSESPLEPPEVRADDAVYDVDVEVDVRLQGPLPELEPTRPTPETRRLPIGALGAAAATPEPESPKTTGSRPAPERSAPPAPETAESSHERRKNPRGVYSRRVPAFGDRAMRVLVARDLSMGGVRVEADTGLQLGERLHLAVYGSAEEEPFLVWATVARDDGPDGMALVFDAIHPVIAQQLEQVVADLPAVESLHDEETRAMGTVITEILDR
jgi:hypothetical protein